LAKLFRRLRRDWFQELAQRFRAGVRQLGVRLGPLEPALQPVPSSSRSRPSSRRCAAVLCRKKPSSSNSCRESLDSGGRKRAAPQRASARLGPGNFSAQHRPCPDARWLCSQRGCMWCRRSRACHDTNRVRGRPCPVCLPAAARCVKSQRHGTIEHLARLDIRRVSRGLAAHHR